MQSIFWYGNLINSQDVAMTSSLERRITGTKRKRLSFVLSYAVRSDVVPNLRLQGFEGRVAA